MDSITSGTRSPDSAKSGADLPVTAQEDFVRGVYRAVDNATARGLERLRREEGIIPNCKRGCCHCCRYLITANVAEAHTLAQYIRRELSADQTDGLRMRTQQWHDWDNSRPGRYRSAPVGGQTNLSDYTPCCPLLVNDECIAYPVRPLVCRTHLVHSQPSLCEAAIDPKATADIPVVLAAIVNAARPFSLAMKDHIESTGLDFSRSIMLLPHWLALEMGWDFAIPL
jgi:hypothetical protein